MENKIEKYKDLPESIYEKFDSMTDEAYDLFANNKYAESFKKYEECLDLIPAPKKEYGDSSNVIEWMVENYLKLKDYSNAIIWVERLGEFLKNKEILGDWEFLKGKVYFEAGDFTKSLENFNIVYRKTNTSLFEDEDPQYFDFYKNPEKYIKE